MNDEAAPSADEPPVLTDEERRVRRRRLTWLLTPIVFFSITGMAINILAPAMIDTHPLVVIFFNPINRYLIIASNSVSTVSFFAVAFFRLVALDPLYFLLGHWYGEGALNWMENKTGNTGLIPMVKRGFAKAGPVIVVVAPNAYVCLLAGAAGMSPAMFIGLNVVGTVGRLLLIRQTASFFESPIDGFKDWLQHYQWWLVGLSAVLILFQYLSNRKKGKGDVQSVSSLEAELEASIEAAEDRDPE